MHLPSLHVTYPSFLCRDSLPKHQTFRKSTVLNLYFASASSAKLNGSKLWTPGSEFGSVSRRGRTRPGSAGSRQKGVCFYFFGAEKNQHAPALHLLNMRHAATQTRPGVCRIHFHLRHFIVSRRSSCSGGPVLRCGLRGACVEPAGAYGGLRWPTRWVEWIWRRRLRRFVSLAFIGSVLRRPSLFSRRRWKCNIMFSNLASCRARGAQPCHVRGWSDRAPRPMARCEGQRERVNRATLHSLFSLHLRQV